MNFEPTEIRTTAAADRRILINALTLIALGLSILFLNSWDNLVVRTSVGLFWGTFMLVLIGPDALRTFRRFSTNNDTQRRGSIPNAN